MSRRTVMFMQLKKEVTMTTEKIKMQIEQQERYLQTLHGNTSSVKMKKYAIQEKIKNLKERK